MSTDESHCYVMHLESLNRWDGRISSESQVRKSKAVHLLENV
jgi:hypothetical protein